MAADQRTVTVHDADGKARPRQTLISAPGPDSMIQPSDVLVLIGADAAIEAFPTQ